MISKKKSTPYLDFCKTNRPLIRSQHPGMIPSEITRELGRRWQQHKRYCNRNRIVDGMALLVLGALLYLGWNITDVIPTHNVLPTIVPTIIIDSLIPSNLSFSLGKPISDPSEGLWSIPGIIMTVMVGLWL